MDRITKIVFFASAAVIVVLALFVFARGGNEEELFPENPIERPAGRKPLSMAGSSAKGSGVDFVASSDETRESMASIVEALKSGDEDRISDAILEMEHLGTEDMLALAPFVMNISDPEYRRDVIARFEGMPHRGAIAVLADVAESDSDPSVRAAAISAMAVTEEGLAVELAKAKMKGNGDMERLMLDERDMEIAARAIRSAVNDRNEEVRREVMDNLSRFSAELQYSGMMSAVKAEDIVVRKDVLTLAQGDYNKETVAVVMKALDDGNESIREDARDFLNHMLDQEFNSTKEAEAWWEQNSHKYNYDLVEE